MMGLSGLNSAKVCLAAVVLLGLGLHDLAAQSDSTSLSMDAVYERPFLQNGTSLDDRNNRRSVAMGGYLEANAIYGAEDGLSEGLSFQARRMTLFMSARLARGITFMSETEFEAGGHEISIEFAAVDVAINPALNFRGGIVMNPIGSFNQNHDGPNWAFVERPDVGVNLLPATWSNAGFGLFGKGGKGNWTLGYEVYLTNGFNNAIIDNEENRTWLPASKEGGERFEESSNGKPLLTAKVAVRHHRWGELGFSYMGGVYNAFEPDGLTVDIARRADVWAIDFNKVFKNTGTSLVGEAVLVMVDVPETYTQQYGSQQRGAFLDVIQSVAERKIGAWPNAVVNVAARLDWVDWNVGTFVVDGVDTGTDIGDGLWAITPAVSLRPSAQTVFRLNYRYQWQTDILNNPAALSANWLLGLSTYF